MIIDSQILTNMEHLSSDREQGHPKPRRLLLLRLRSHIVPFLPTRLHPVDRLLIVLELGVERLRDRLIRNIIVRRSDSSRGDDESVSLVQPPDSLNNLVLVVCDDLDPLEVYSDVEEQLGHEVAVRVLGLAVQHLVSDDEARGRLYERVLVLGSGDGGERVAGELVEVESREGGGLRGEHCGVRGSEVLEE